ncbi:hypothetical protein ILUMI_03856 [Ignelater luminosus]|uniref:Uncharacterized protein n=1 Tax=Ignelater luminosus TaxID=2038154 RepID=A0A8K0DFT4_IGNLU|nr:hypothetical protein ILUMI_03856 [Ignelater luminosus]
MDTDTLDDLRYQQFTKSVWLGREKNPLDWGWMSTTRGLTLIKTTQNTAPHFFAAHYAVWVYAAATKVGLTCSAKGHGCENSPETGVRKIDIEDFDQQTDEIITQEDEDIDDFPCIEEFEDIVSRK